MIRTSLHGRSARGRAAETAARPPTRTKSSISVVTNRTFKNALVPAQKNANATSYARKGPTQGRVQSKIGANARAGPAAPWGKRFPAKPTQFRVTPRQESKNRKAEKAPG